MVAGCRVADRRSDGCPCCNEVRRHRSDSVGRGAGASDGDEHHGSAVADRGSGRRRATVAVAQLQIGVEDCQLRARAVRHFHQGVECLAGANGLGDHRVRLPESMTVVADDLLVGAQHAHRVVGDARVHVAQQQFAVRRRGRQVCPCTVRSRVHRSVDQRVLRGEVAHVESGRTGGEVVQRRVDLADQDNRFTIAAVRTTRGRRDDQRAIQAHRHLVLRVRDRSSLIDVGAGLRGIELVRLRVSWRYADAVGGHGLAANDERRGLGQLVVQFEHHMTALRDGQRWARRLGDRRARPAVAPHRHRLTGHRDRSRFGEEREGQGRGAGRADGGDEHRAERGGEDREHGRQSAAASGPRS